ncbi:class I SAM-dependent methyltransferase [Sphingobacterium sp. SRCM116780]|uniref:methyltransferase domain-containing protein n=1 Tax=Sphingobacterium sp. SRCM116780 TaxID=2907623 RepID=UPI001F1820F0|nr:methyltransferase domain-containing protein [Sphingobacterium sp. SRCM116780]UIR56918.1 class I SAM-dependent methyltransferase [Sphingobacterium sp. SRCM116780]
MEQVRKPFQGVLNIIRFNWHFYIIALLFFAGLFFCYVHVPPEFKIYVLTFTFLAISSTLLSLLASLYIYDLSDFYALKWLKKEDKFLHIVNINAGFDETTPLLQQVYTNSTVQVFDFYNEEKHTEVSIKRARKAYPQSESIINIETNSIPLASQTTDKVFLILAAHEIRNSKERTRFLKEINRILKPNAEVYVIEHLRDIPNFLAFNIGFLHFHRKKTWIKNFKEADLTIVTEHKHTAFITIFKLAKND